jgi:flagellar basal body-associated protein FliL
MFVLILVGLLYVFVDFGDMQKNHQNQHKHTKEPPKSTKTYKRTTKINTNIQKTNQNQQKHTSMFLLILVVLLYVCVDFGGSFVCFC